MSNTSVLVVDDDMAICRIVQEMLAKEEFDVQISQSVADALQVIEEKLFGIYLLDFKLQDGSGLDVVELIRSKRSAAPIVLMSGYDSSAFALRAQKLRITHFLQKPFSSATVCDAVKHAATSTSVLSQSVEQKRHQAILHFLSKF